MDYKCRKVSVDRLLSTPKGFLKPLCDTCATADCTNPIEKTRVSFIGIKKEVRAFVVGDSYSFVIYCEGYSNAEI